MSAAADFERDMMAEFHIQESDVKKKVIEIADYAVDQVIARSPVLSGRFKANWNSSIGVADPHTTLEVDPNGARTTKRMKRKIAEYKNFANYPPIYLTEGLPYALRLENGYSKQAPSGIVAVTVAAVNAKFWAVDI